MMNLKRITPALTAGGVTTLLAACKGCGGAVRSDTGFADLAGPPFAAYYCDACGAHWARRRARPESHREAAERIASPPV